jgi:hypothetical protein
MIDIIKNVNKIIHTGIWETQLASWQQTRSSGFGISLQCPQQHQSGFGLFGDGWCPPGCGCVGFRSWNIKVGFASSIPTANSRSFSAGAEFTILCNKHFMNLMKTNNDK